MKSEQNPKIIAIAGPNGAGKSTLAPRLLRDLLQIKECVNADTIAAGLSAFNSQGAALEAGRIALKRYDYLASQRISFAFETTLAARSYALRIHQLCQQGYDFYLFYLWLRDVEIAIERVKERVRLGGHDIPQQIIRQRYARGMNNFHHLYKPMAINWGLYDNSDVEELRIIAAGSKDSLIEIYEKELWSEFCGGVK